jgi:hypothetical protein
LLCVNNILCRKRSQEKGGGSLAPQESYQKGLKSWMS